MRGQWQERKVGLGALGRREGSAESESSPGKGEIGRYSAGQLMTALATSCDGQM